MDSMRLWPRHFDVYVLKRPRARTASSVVRSNPVRSFALQYLQKDTTVRFLSHFDSQTGLAKRALFCERLARVLLDPVAGRARHAVCVFDIGNLGLINDSLGRRMGDLLLQHVAARLKRRFPKTDSLSHFGGGTFAMVGECGTRSEEESIGLIHTQVAAVFEDPFVIEQREVPAAIRSGVALHPQDGNDAEILVQRAEAALLYARASGERRLRYSAIVVL